MEVEANNKLITLSNETKKLVSELIPIVKNKKDLRSKIEINPLIMVPIDSIRYKKIKNFLIQRLNEGIKWSMEKMQETENYAYDCNTIFECCIGFLLVDHDSYGGNFSVELNFKEDWEDDYDTSKQPDYSAKHGCGCLSNDDKEKRRIGQIKFMPIEQVTEIYDKYADDNSLICLRSFDYTEKDFDVITFSFILKR